LHFWAFLLCVVMVLPWVPWLAGLIAAHLVYRAVQVFTAFALS